MTSTTDMMTRTCHSEAVPSRCSAVWTHVSLGVLRLPLAACRPPSCVARSERDRVSPYRTDLHTAFSGSPRGSARNEIAAPIRGVANRALSPTHSPTSPNHEQQSSSHAAPVFPYCACHSSPASAPAVNTVYGEIGKDPRTLGTRGVITTSQSRVASCDCEPYVSRRPVPIRHPFLVLNRSSSPLCSPRRAQGYSVSPIPEQTSLTCRPPPALRLSVAEVATRCVGSNPNEWQGEGEAGRCRVGRDLKGYNHRPVTPGAPPTPHSLDRYYCTRLLRASERGHRRHL
ncbi:hypothetical protein O3P69_000534 [Scylla paramamosain]|uniref:Uncharacterized protein n=1 Tax=Scylla paramamosain TaxID=85552 RepID=A0AAW0UUH6_SCYPA